ncbi:PTS mannose/fructose/sorbose/N-acetylgalactosamine transporter subunit IIC [Klebsiella pneumoniae]
MLLTATLLGLIAALGILDGRLLGVSMIDRPLVMCALTGLVCGNLHEGILIGATLELIFLGNVAIGAAHPPDIVTGSVLATAFSIMSGRGPEAALTIAIPVSMLAQTLGILVRVVNARFGHLADRYAAQGNTRMVGLMHLAGPTLLYFLNGFLPVFFAIPVITNGLIVASKILPALGFALLISMMLSSKLMPYLGLGFLIAAYTKLDIIAIALFAVVLAFIISQFLNLKQQES